MAQDEFMTVDEAAAFLKITPSTLAYWRGRRRRGPPWYKWAQKIYYHRNDLLDYVESCHFNTAQTD
jgi:hypothetical protein